MKTQQRHFLHLLLLSTITVLAAALVCGPAVAHAAPLGSPPDLGEATQRAHADSYGPGIWHHTSRGTTWYGSYRTFPKGPAAYCIDAGKQSPLPEYFVGAQAKSVTSAKTAWALHRFSGSTSKHVQAALSAIARLDESLPHDHKVPARVPAELGEKFAKSAQKYASITAEAKKYAGPYTLDLELTRPPETFHAIPYGKAVPDGQDAAANNVGEDTPAAGAHGGMGTDNHEPMGRKTWAKARTAVPPAERLNLRASVTSASGHKVPDVVLDLDFTGVKKAPGTLTTKNTPVVLPLAAAAPGKVTVRGSARLPSDSVLLYEPQSGTRVQRVVTAAEPVRITGSAAVSMSSRPTVSTTISHKSPKPGEPITDSFTVSGLIGSHTVDVDHQLWATKTQPRPGKKNADARSIGTVTSHDVGNGSHESPALDVPEDYSGWLYFTETIAENATTEQWKGVHAQRSETGFIPWTPTASTRAVLDDDKVHDEVTVTGLRPKSETTITVTAFRTPTKPQQSSQQSGRSLDSQDFTVVADISGRAEVSTTLIDMPIGWVTFVTSVEKTPFSTAWTSDWGIPEETVERAEEESQEPPRPEPPHPNPPAPTDEPPAPPKPSEEPTTPPAPPRPSEEPTAPGDTPPSFPEPGDEPDQPENPVDRPESPQKPVDEPDEEPVPTDEPDEPKEPVTQSPEEPLEEPGPVESPAEEPAAQEPVTQLPRTGTSRQGMFIGAGIVLIGLGLAAIALSRRTKE